MPGKNRYASMLFICWLTYSCAYFCRVNFSLAIPSLQAEFGWDKGALGLLASGFFAAYAAGQLINGLIGDRFNPRWFVAVGLVVAGFSNVAMALSNSYGVMLVLWTLNGYFQSMLWGPIVRTTSVYTPPEKHSTMAVILSTSMVVGYLVSYQSIGRLAEAAHWRAMFWLPGLLLLGVAVLWMVMLRPFAEDDLNRKAHQAAQKADAREASAAPMGFLSFLWKSKLWLVALICILQGIIKEGISLWGPTFISESQGLSFATALNVLSFVPVMNLGGVLLVGVINKFFRYQEKRTLLFFQGVCVVFSVVLYVAGGAGPAVTIGSFSILSAGMFGVNSVLTTFIPLNFYKMGRVSTAAGFVDCAAYVGAALSGPAMGVLADSSGWDGAILLWVGAALAAMVLSALSRNYKKRIFKEAAQGGENAPAA